jgi:tetratricopeptide (TPR) repeat protein
MLSLFFFLFSLFFCFFGCSSAPKKPAEIVAERNIAANQLNLANSLAARGRYKDALSIVDEARRMARATDDPSLRIKTTMSRGSILFSMGLKEEAFLEWENAQREGDDSGAPVLAALVRIYVIRARLVLLANETGTDSAAEELKSQLSREMAVVRSDQLSTAAGYVTLGMAEKQLRRWAEAENAVKQALAIHEKSLSLEDAAYDWFVIASIRSVAGNHDAALEALRMAISFDRRAENGFGLASSWKAMGDVYQKAGRAGDSESAYRRAAEILEALGIDRAEKLE